MNPYKMKSPYFNEVVCVVQDQGAYDKALEKWPILEDKIPIFSEKELVFISETTNMKTASGKAEIRATEKLKKMFHAKVVGIPKDFDHHAIVLARLDRPVANIYLAAQKTKKENSMDRMRLAATG